MPNIRVRPSLTIEMKQRCLQSNALSVPPKGDRRSPRTSSQFQRKIFKQTLKNNVNLSNKKKGSEKENVEKDDIETVNKRVLTAMGKRKCKELENEDKQKELLQKIQAEI